VLTTIDGDELTLRAALFSPDGTMRVEATASFPAGNDDGPTALARDLLAKAPEGIAAHFDGAR